MADALTGRTARRQYDLARQAQEEQRAQLARQEERLRLVQEAQQNVARGGGGGLLAYIDKRGAAADGGPADDSRLKKVFGGRANAA